MSKSNKLTNEKYSLSISNGDINFISGFEPIYDLSGNPVGFVESRASRLERGGSRFYRNIMIVVISVISITVLVFIFF